MVKLLCFNALFRAEGCRFCANGTCRFTDAVEGKHFQAPDSATEVIAAVSSSDGKQHCLSYFEGGACGEEDCGRIHAIRSDMLAPFLTTAFAQWKPTYDQAGGPGRGRGRGRGAEGHRGRGSENRRGRGGDGSRGRGGESFRGRGGDTSQARGRGGNRGRGTTSNHGSVPQGRLGLADASQSKNESSLSDEEVKLNVPDNKASSPAKPRPPRPSSAAHRDDRKRAVQQTALCWFHIFSARKCFRGDACWSDHEIQSQHVCGVDISQLISLLQSQSDHRAHCRSYFDDGECPVRSSCGSHHTLTLAMMNPVQQASYAEWKARQRRDSVSSTTSTMSTGSAASDRSSSSSRTRGTAPRQATGPTKPQSERDADREKSNFPILRCKEEFVQRLSNEKIVVVTAATGSGKTTQLPQYAAEDPRFQHGLVICTQPRAIAALSISQRIAEEYDGDKKGNSVGYRIGGGKEKIGTRMMLTTDAALVRMAQRDRKLSDISVLIIDEAHERSLNTDLVVAISKLVLKERPHDFHVVIASATINPTPFLQYYFGMQQYVNHPVLNVPGNLHPVTIEEIPVNAEDVSRQAFSNHLLKVVKKTLVKQTEGHCLVFLPGSGEIESAIKAFSKDKQDDWIPKALYGGLPPEVQGEVLAFDDDGGRLRMVCFCTNVAETSLTVPNVRIVIDSGLAKEARFDVRRRMNVVEEVYISVASADQRKGRAGRTAPGHCVRLYTTQDLTRANIEPEILRSSLDMVVLQLVKLGYDPLEFPFMDRPESDLLEASVDLLAELRCLESRTSRESKTSWSLTSRGQLFNELPFDPRMSSFVVLAFEKDPLFLGAAAEVAAILTAPGTIFFMGGAGKAEKMAKQSKISSWAALHDSDLLFLRSVYREWFESGEPDSATGRCKGCGDKVSARFGCKRCRKAVATEMSLNQKVISIVQGTVDQVTATITKMTASKNSSKPTQGAMKRTPSKGTLEVVLGECLAKCFFDQVCQVILPSKPEAGVYLLEADEKGSIANTSTVSQRVGGSNAQALSFYIAMSVNRIPSGEYKVEKLHRILLDWLPDSRRGRVKKKAFNVEPCYVRENVPFGYQRKLELHFLRWSERYRAQLESGQCTPRGAMPRLHEIQDVEPQPFADFAVCAYEQADHALYVFGPQRYASSIASIAEVYLSKLERDLLDYQTSEVIGRGTAVATLMAGLEIDRIDLVGLACRFTLEKLPKTVNGKKTLEEFVLRELAKIDPKGKHIVRWSRFYSLEEQLQHRNSRKNGGDSATEVESRGIVVLATDKSAQAAQKALSQHIVVDDTGGGPSKQRLATNETWGRLVLWKLANFLEPEMAKQSLGAVRGLLQVGLTRLFARDVSFVAYKNPEFKIKLRNIPMIKTEVFLKALLPHNTDVRVFLYEPKFGVRNGTMSFKTAQERNASLLILQASSFAALPVTIQLEGGSKEARPEFTVGPDEQGSATYELLFDSSAAADAFLASQPSTAARGYAQVEVSHASLYSLSATIQALQDRFSVESVQYDADARPQTKGAPRRQSKSGGSTRVVFLGSSARACGQACQSLSMSVSPLRILVSNLEQGKMLDELDKCGQLKAWEQELHLHVQRSRSGANKATGRDGRLTGITIFGAGEKQGRLMRYIAEYATTFSERFASLQLGENAGLFREGRVGYSTLIKLRKELGKDCEIEYDKFREAVQIFIPASVAKDRFAAIQTRCTDAIDEVLSASTQGKAATVRRVGGCVYCGMKSDLNLSVCGHDACKACLTDVIREHTETCENDGDPFLPVACRACGKRVSVVDLKTLESKDVLNRAYQAAARSFLQCQANSTVTLCPSNVCGAFLPRVDRYTTCSSCGDGVCTLCRTINDDLHENRTCDQYERELSLSRVFDMGELFRRAEQWANENWDASIASQFSVAQNRSLLGGCPAFDRYIDGIIKLGGLKEVSSRRFFAWHGTAEPAIGPICHNGFDPGRRSGQAYGAGEYFGQSASVSMGYVRGSSRLIVAEIVNDPTLVKVVNNFCYVVSNPTDWSLSFNVPVLVLSFKDMLGSQPPLLPADRGRSLESVLSKLDSNLGSNARSPRRRRSSGYLSPSSKELQSWCSPFRWMWWDGSKFEPYADSITSLLEEAYTRGEITYRTPAIVRYLDDIPQEYIIRFRSEHDGKPLSDMEQINAKTSYRRRIQRETCELPPLQDIRWTYSESGRWQKFESSVQRLIEDAFGRYISQSSTGNSKYILRFPGRPEEYELDFVQGTQRNLTSLTQRQIRRINFVKEEIHEETTIDVNLTERIRSEKWLKAVREVLVKMVSAALASTGGKTSGQQDASVAIAVRDDPHRGGQLVLTTNGAATTICSLLVARVRTILFEDHGVITPLRSIQARGPSGKQMLKNPRLLQLVSKNPPTVWTTRDDVMLQIAHAVIWQAGCPIYGGFVRDWVLLGESANDIDVQMDPSKTTISAISDILQQLLDQHPQFQFSLTDRGQKGAAHCLKVTSPKLKKAIEVDLVDKLKVPYTPPGVDSDVGNILVFKDGLHKKFANADSGRVSLAKVLLHTQRKEFVFYYDLSTGDDAVMKRLCKYLDRQWTCLSLLPDQCIKKLTDDQKKYLRPKTKYTHKWWVGRQVRTPEPDDDVPEKSSCHTQ